MLAFSNAEQLHLVLQSVLLGAGIGLFYDVLRAFRRQFAFGCVVTAVCDALFWLVLLGALFEFNLLFAPGQNRYFILAGAAGGAAMYFGLLSALALAVLESILGALVWALRLPGRAARALRRFAQAVGLRDKCRFFVKKFAKPSSIFGRKGIK